MIEPITVPPSTCPTCGYVCDSATAVTGENVVRARPGDISICLKCGDVLQFGEAMRLRVADLNSLVSLTDEDRDIIGRAQKLIRSRVGKLPSEK